METTSPPAIAIQAIFYDGDVPEAENDEYAVITMGTVAIFTIRAATMYPHTAMVTSPKVTSTHLDRWNQYSTAMEKRSANLRGGPGISYHVIGGVQSRQALRVVAMSAAGGVVPVGQWIAAFLVDNMHRNLDMLNYLNPNINAYADNSRIGSANT